MKKRGNDKWDNTKNMKIPYFDLKRQYSKLAPELKKAVLNVVESGRYILSDEVANFENAFAKYLGACHALGVASGTDALILGLKACGIGPGDEVIVPSFTFSATAMAIVHAGATPVFCDVNEKTFCLDPGAAKKLMTRKTKALLPVHLYGHAADMTALLKLARRYKLKVIEDACQAHGAEWKGKKCGSFADVSAFSFYPTKNLGALGDGGMAVTNSAKVAQTIQCLRNLGRPNMKATRHELMGWTSRLDALQAAALHVKLKRLDGFNNNRRKIAGWYSERLRSTPLTLPSEAAGARHVYHLFVVRVPGGKREALMTHLANEGIGTMIHYPYAVDRQPALKPYLRKKPHLPVTEQIFKEILSLPLFPEMTLAEVDIVCRAIHQFFRS